MWVRSQGLEGTLQKEMVTHSNVLAWRVSWTEEPGWLQSRGSKESDMTEVTQHALVEYKVLKYFSTLA